MKQNPRNSHTPSGRMGVSLRMHVPYSLNRLRTLIDSHPQTDLSQVLLLKFSPVPSTHTHTLMTNYTLPNKTLAPVLPCAHKLTSLIRQHGG